MNKPICITHNIKQLSCKSDKRSFVCPSCNGLTKEELIKLGKGEYY